MKKAAESYEPKKSRTIDELKEVSMKLDVKEMTRQDRDGEDYTYNYVEVDGKEYRIPGPVLDQLKVQLKENPDLQRYKVNKEGEGYNSKYTVIILPNKAA